jgi:hypothetical protein
VRIVVLQRGWVIVGRYKREGFYGRITEGAVVRRWGTAGNGKGLGWLAEYGPTEETHLESCPQPIEFHELAVVCQFVCNEAAWEGKTHG